jgi:long-chain acyl-CoA synthetase
MLYTSGTTGRPKGVHRPSAPSVTQVLNLFGYSESGTDAHLCTGPLYHAAPLAFSLALPLAFGVGVVVMEQWEAEEALRLIDAHRITHTHMVPTMFHRLLSLPPDVRAKYDTSSLRNILHGAAPCPVSVKSALIEWLGPIVWEYYAATEGTGTFVDSATWLTKPGTVGRPMVEGLVQVGDPDGNPLPAGEIGLVYLRAPATGRFEYFNDQAKTAGSYRGDYFTLGDVGYMDDDGFLFLTDRSANLIISGGVNIYPAEVDAVLIGHPAVGDVATIGVPNPEWGEEVKAVVELQSGFEPSDALARELLAYCRDRLSHFKCPRSVDFTEHLPRQDNGKIYKRLLRDQYR